MATRKVHRINETCNSTHTHIQLWFQKGFYFDRRISDIRPNTMTIKLTELAYWQFSKLNVIFAHQISFALTPRYCSHPKRDKYETMRWKIIWSLCAAWIGITTNKKPKKREGRKINSMAIGLCYFIDKNLNWN